MWIFYAIASSFFAGITSILAKCGIQKTNSNVATVVFHEKLTKKAIVGLIFIVIGTILLALF